MTTRINTDNVIFCPPPPGKPDIRLPISPYSVELRPRVVQKRGEGENTSLYLAMDQIRRRIGRCSQQPFWYSVVNFFRPWFGLEPWDFEPWNELTRMQRTEKVVSQHRKLLRSIDQIYERVIRAARKYGTTSGSNKRQTMRRYLNRQPREVKEKYHTLKRAFHQSGNKEAFVTFVARYYIEEKIKAEMAFLELKRDGRQVNNCSSDGMNLEKTLRVLEACTFHRCAALYKLKTTALWRPHRGIDYLMHALRRRGSLCMRARLGPQYYQQQPRLLAQSVGEREIYAWDLNTQRKERKEVDAIVVVGATHLMDRVYFINPLEDSSEQRVYVVRYEMFIENVCDLDGKDPLNNEHQVGPAHAGSRFYALYGPQNYL